MHSLQILLFLWNLLGSSISCGRKHLDIIQQSILLSKESGYREQGNVAILVIIIFADSLD